MDFDFSAEQVAVRDLARELFEKESPPSRLRELWGASERDRSVWKALGQAGLLEIRTDLRHGWLNAGGRALARR